jgi:hypothetical protein
MHLILNIVVVCDFNDVMFIAILQDVSLAIGPKVFLITFKVIDVI